MFKNSYKIATVWGIPIKVHISLILLLAFVALQVGRIGGLRAIAVLLILEFGIVFSIALHELGHSFIALRKGARVREITLMFIGGAAQIERIPERPRDELVMALAGPAVSVVLGLVLWFGGGWLPLQAYWWPFLGLDVACNMVQLIGVINLVLAAFNLLPAFPMDGGRVFRALLTLRMGRLRATFVASRLGRVLAMLLGAYGLLADPTRWLLIVIAVFIYSAAGREYRMVRLTEAARHMDEPFGGRWPFGSPPPPAPQDDVVIGPAPYERGGKQHVDLHR